MTYNTNAPEICIKLQQDELCFELQGQKLGLSTKWKVFYGLLALLKENETLSFTELHLYAPWSEARAQSVSSSVRRFIRESQEKYFGQNIHRSFEGQESRIFALHPEIVQNIRFEPTREAISEHLAKQQVPKTTGNYTGLLNQYKLNIQTGQVKQTLSQLQALMQQSDLTLDERAHAQVLITTALDRMHGHEGTGTQLSAMLALYHNNKVSQPNRIELLIRIARHHTLSEEYAHAKSYFRRLLQLINPEQLDTTMATSYCYFCINYGLYLRRIHQIKEGIRYTKIAYERAIQLELWYVIQGAQSNLALMHLTLAKNAKKAKRSPQKIREHLMLAKQWAYKGVAINEKAPQGGDEADTFWLLGEICRRLGHYKEARQWLMDGVQFSKRIQNYPDLHACYKELEKLENELGNLDKAAMWAIELARSEKEDERQRPQDNEPTHEPAETEPKP